MKFRVVDDQRRPVAGAVVVVVPDRLTRAELRVLPSETIQRESRLRSASTDADGIATVVNYRGNADVTVHLDTRGATRVVDSREAPGPIELVLTELPVPERRPDPPPPRPRPIPRPRSAIVEGRLAVPPDRRFATTQRSVSLWAAEVNEVLDRSGHVNADGGFRFECVPNSDARRWFVVDPRLPDHVWWTFRRDGLTAGLHDVGTLPVANVRVLVTGNVLDDDDRPVRNIDFVVERVTVDANGVERFEPAYDVGALSTDPQFVLQGADLGMPLRIHVQTSYFGRLGSRSHTVRVPAGADSPPDVTLRVSTGGVIRGRLRATPDLVRAIEVVVSANDGGPPFVARPSRGGTFAVPHVPAGVNDVAFLVPGAGAWIVARDVVVARGAATSDPQLADVEVSGFRPLVLVVEEPDGRAVEGVVECADGATVRLDERGRATLWVAGPVDVAIVPWRGTRMHVTGLASDKVVVVPR